MQDDSWGPGRDVTGRWRLPGHSHIRLSGGELRDDQSGRRALSPVPIVVITSIVLVAVFIALLASGGGS